MKAIVTGAAGFLGSRLCPALLEAGWRVIGVGRGPRPATRAKRPGFSWLRRDLSREGLLPSELAGVDALFHLAGATAGAGEDERLFLAENELTAFHAFRSCAGRVGRIVHASSQAVYGDPASLAVDESFPLDPAHSAYALSKVHAENWLRHFQKRAGGRAVCLRLTGFIEGGGAVDHFIARARRGEPIELFARGRVRRDYLAAKDGVAAFLAAAGAPSPEGVEFYNIGSGQGLSAMALARLVCAELGSGSAIVPVAKPAPKSDLVFKVDKARAGLGWRAVPLEEAVRGYLRSMRADEPGERVL